MRTDLGPKGHLYPMPVLIIGSYDENGIPDAMNAAWGGISDYKELSISVAAEHKTVSNILSSGGFTVSMADLDNLARADYVGLVSAYDVPDKIARCGWTAVKSSFVNAPLFAELPLTLECELVSYDEGSERLVGKIVNLSAEERILTEGHVDLSKFSPLVFTPDYGYYTLGKRVGNAFSDGKKIK